MVISIPTSELAFTSIHQTGNASQIFTETSCFTASIGGENDAELRWRERLTLKILILQTDIFDFAGKDKLGYFSIIGCLATGN